MVANSVGRGSTAFWHARGVKAASTGRLGWRWQPARLELL